MSADMEMVRSPAGPAVVVLKSDTRHALRASHAVLVGGVLTARVSYGLRSWPMSEVAVVKWLVEPVPA